MDCWFLLKICTHNRKSVILNFKEKGKKEPKQKQKTKTKNKHGEQ